MSCNVLLTGGLGYIGSNIAVKLLEKNYNVCIIDNLSNTTIDRLDKIEIQLNIINEKQYDIDKSTKNMDNHIQFVENVYDKIKQPLAYATNKINYFISSNDSLNNTNLPELT